MTVAVDLVPTGRLSLKQVAQRVHGHYLAHCRDEGEAEWRTRFAMEGYTAYPDPCVRLATRLEEELAAYDAAPADIQTGWWAPFIETARTALSLLRSEEEETRKEAFRVFVHLQALQKRVGRCADVRLDIPVLPNREEFADVIIREVPEDEKLRGLLHRRAWMKHLSRPGPKMVWNGKPQPYPSESMSKAQEELDWINQAIVDHLGQ